MSRCFPYPPPGYALTSDRKEALIESIKFQKEKVKAAEELRKKDKKREKKEKKKEKEKKDERIRTRDIYEIVHDCIGKKFRVDAKADFLHTGITSDSEQLERSSLTEEHGKPVYLRVPSSSSDSTENSNKRKRPPSPVNVSHDVSRGHGKIIRIRLSSKKRNQLESHVDEQKHCSTSGRTQFSPQVDNDFGLRQRSEGFCSTSGSTTLDVGRSLVLKTGGERYHLASKQAETVPFVETRPLPMVDAVLTPVQKEALLYNNLIENWAPPRFQDLCVDTTDEDWLFGGVNQRVAQFEKKSTCRDEIISDCNMSSLCPRAQYMPEVDIYALPYTLPF